MQDQYLELFSTLQMFAYSELASIGLWVRRLYSLMQRKEIASLQLVMGQVGLLDIDFLPKECRDFPTKSLPAMP